MDNYSPTIKKDYLSLTLADKLVLVLAVRQSRRTSKASPSTRANSNWKTMIDKLSIEQVKELANRLGVNNDGNN